MKRKNQYEKEYEKYAKSRKKDIDDLISHNFQSNSDDYEHKMLVERQKLTKVYDALSPLERADLEDYQSKENDERPNKKRRNLLR